MGLTLLVLSTSGRTNNRDDAHPIKIHHNLLKVVAAQTSHRFHLEAQVHHTSTRESVRTTALLPGQAADRRCQDSGFGCFRSHLDV